jgi:hypothetical protein
MSTSADSNLTSWHDWLEVCHYFIHELPDEEEYAEIFEGTLCQTVADPAPDTSFIEEGWVWLQERNISWPDSAPISRTSSSEASFDTMVSDVSAVSFHTAVTHLPGVSRKTRDVFKDLDELSRWDLAVLRAVHAAAAYRLHLMETGPPMPDPTNEQKSLQGAVNQRKEGRLEKELRILYDARLTCPAGVKRSAGEHVRFPTRNGVGMLTADFARFCRKFIETHGKQVCQSLLTCFRGPFHLKVALLGEEKQRSFLDVCSGRHEGTLRPALHGTAVGNLPSIYKHGLLVPGEKNSVKVANGSTHGRGIYTARLTNPSLSWGFCHGGTSILVCGVLDNAASVAEPYCNGRFRVERQSNEVLHVGDAMVIFDANRVAPLFVATRASAPQAGRQATSAKTITVSPPERRQANHAAPMTRVVKCTVRKSAEAFLLRRGAKRRRE